MSAATTSAERALDLMREENAALRRAHEVTQAEADRRVADLDAQLAAMRADLEGARQQAEELHRQIEASRSSTELADLQARNSELLADLQAARDDRGRVEGELLALRQRHEAFESEQREALAAAQRAHGEASARADEAARALDKTAADLEDARKALETARKERGEAEGAARQAREAVAEAERRTGEARKTERDLAAAQRAVAENERRIEELSAENENLKLGHKAQTRRVSQLLAELRSARGDTPAAAVDPAELDAAHEALAKAEQDRDASNERLARAQREAADARAREQAQAARVGELEGQLRAVAKELEEKRASAPVATASNGDATTVIRPLFDKVNELASVWRNNMTLIDDFIEEMNDPDAATREEAFEQIGIAVSSCRDATKEMKDALREVRKVLHSDS
jgi:chromosome segregation ATPase